MFRPIRKTLSISSPVKSLDRGEYGQFLSPASRRKFYASMENGRQLPGVKFSAGKNKYGQSEVQRPTKKTQM